MVVVPLKNSVCRTVYVLAGILLIVAGTPAFAGSGFIESARVSAVESGETSGAVQSADIEVRFNCKAQYLRHEPQTGGDRLRIYLDPTGICNGVSPVVAESRSRLRPFNADNAQLIDLEYDGDSTVGPVLTMTFSKAVAFEVDMSGVSFGLAVRVRASRNPGETVDAAASAAPAANHRQVPRPAELLPDFVINLASFRRIPTVADAPGLQLVGEQRLYYTEVLVDDATWYRLRLGDFESAEEATAALAELRMNFDDARVDQVKTGDGVVELAIPGQEASAGSSHSQAGDNTSKSKVESLMEEARKSMAAGETSRAIQIYTKVLQIPGHSRLPEAQEFLALAREKKGQVAHAKAEYQRYLSLYPEGDGANRVSQRLAVLLAGGRQVNQAAGTSVSTGRVLTSSQSDWRLQTYFSQYYRRDVNQLNDQDEIVSQSALYSDINFDARRRGERFDFSSRLSAGYRNDFLDEDVGSGDSIRVSYAYADLTDAVTGLRGRIGRQSRNRGGVLGRFDGLNLGYQLGERVLLNTVAGKPAYSSSDSIDDSRSFYGASINYGPVLENLDLGLFYIEQEIEGIQDRQAVGAEFRYFGSKQNLWGMVDYDLSYGELASAFLQGSWRFGSRLSVHAHVDRRGSPFLSASNAMIGQAVTSFAELKSIFSEDELRQLGRDRTGMSTTVSGGVSYPLTPKLQINADASRSTIDGTPASGGILATEDTSYSYYSSSLIASSLLREGDITIVGVRYSDSGTAQVVSLTLDSRYPIGRNWRINPRLRVDQRQRLHDSNDEWLYTPGIRIQYRRSQKFRVELEAGKQFSQRESFGVDLDRESYFINLGYQSFF